MFYDFATIILTLTFYKILKMKIFYKIILSAIFWVLFMIFTIVFDNIVFNAYCTLTDHIGYNSITNFIRLYVSAIPWIILIIIQIILIFFYIKNNK